MSASNPVLDKGKKNNPDWLVYVSRVNEAGSRFIDIHRFSDQEAAVAFRDWTNVTNQTEPTT